MSAPDPSPQSSMKKFNRSVSLLTWGLNEEALVEGFLDRAFALLDATAEDFEVIFVNDGSTDRTAEILAAYAAKEPRLKVITNEVNMNVGRSCRRAIAAASKDFLLWQTVDWSYDITHLRIFLELTNDFDVVQGVRPVPIRLLSYIPVVRSIYRVKTRSDDLRKAVVSLGNYYLLRILFGVRFHDFQNVTIYPRALIQSVELTGDSSFLNPECLLRTYERGATYLEVPIPFIRRTQGHAKGTKLSSIMRSIRNIVRAWLKWGWQFRLRHRKEMRRRIYRVSEPFHLDEDVLRLVIPLFKEFR
jgi:glycosyltransferase involved in cell wall biosynthesis